ncbi:unnamed protein product [Auanema sp. JU1783]|nr:unnamed protein product [Auanema sp. JU1783]
MEDKELDPLNPLMVEFYELCEKSDIKEKQITYWRAAHWLKNDLADIRKITDASIGKIAKNCCVTRNFAIKAHSLYLNALDNIGEKSASKKSSEEPEAGKKETPDNSEESVMNDSTNTTKNERSSRRKRSVVKRFDDECFDETSARKAKYPKVSPSNDAVSETASSADETESVPEDSISTTEKEAPPVKAENAEDEAEAEGECIVDGKNVWPIIVDLTKNSKAYTGDRLAELRECLAIAIQKSPVDINISSFLKSHTNLPPATFKKFLRTLRTMVKKSETPPLNTDDVDVSVNEPKETEVKAPPVAEKSISRRESGTPASSRKDETESISSRKEESSSSSKNTSKSSKSPASSRRGSDLKEIFLEITPTRPCPYVAANTTLPSYVLDDLDKGQTNFSVPLYPRPGGKTRMEVSKHIDACLKILERFDSPLVEAGKEVIQEAIDMVFMDKRSVEYTACSTGLDVFHLAGLCTMVNAKLTSSPLGDVDDTGLERIFFLNGELELFRQSLVQSLLEKCAEEDQKDSNMILACVDVLIDNMTPTKASYSRQHKLADIENVIKKIGKAWNPNSVINNNSLTEENQKIVNRWQSHYQKRYRK